MADPVSRAAAAERAQGSVPRVGPTPDLPRARRLRSRLLLRQHVHRRALAVSCRGAALTSCPHGVAADPAARRPGARRRAMARRSRSLGPAQRRTRWRSPRATRAGSAVRAHGAAEGAGAAGLCRLLHELRLAQGRPSSPPRAAPRPCCTGTSSGGRCASKGPSCARPQPRAIATSRAGRSRAR